MISEIYQYTLGDNTHIEALGKEV